MRINITDGWSVLQDVHDTGERLGLYRDNLDMTAVGHQLSEWEPLDRLEHLQVALSSSPYAGRELRSFNAAPWWYRVDFDVPDGEHTRVALRLSNVDYFCRVWVDGELLGEHEGYSEPFELELPQETRHPGRHVLMVKVWSPWDTEVLDGYVEERTTQVVRDMAKGTYEHDDTLVPRDVNPVGIYGTVELILEESVHVTGEPRITYSFPTPDEARVAVSATVLPPSAEEDVTARIIGPDGDLVGSAQLTCGADRLYEAEIVVPAPRRWSTWDRGEQALYTVEIVSRNRILVARRFGFRQVTLRRTATETIYHLNGKQIFIRGTSYFPDVYLSQMSRARYLRDLRLIRDAGFNMVRVHVHFESDDFYDLCDELGLAVMQDTDFNWTHPSTPEWGARLTRIVLSAMTRLDRHPSILTWVCLNEPGNTARHEAGRRLAMDVSPGPDLYDAVVSADPTRPVIKGSYCEDDLDSGDSHNYTGSLWGHEGHYTDIDGSTEKLNTEFGFDAPGRIEDLRRWPSIYKRARALDDWVRPAQAYQYDLIKYYIDHYRAQKHRPCGGYVHFMFIDVAPQSFYGILDWAGIPKRGYEAVLESNAPVAVLLDRSATSIQAVCAVNDTPWSIGPATVTYTITARGETLARESQDIHLGPDAIVTVPVSVDLNGRDDVLVHLGLTDGGGRTIANNSYRNPHVHLSHIQGHPHRMSHEWGMRLYGA